MKYSIFSLVLLAILSSCQSSTEVTKQPAEDTVPTAPPPPLERVQNEIQEILDSAKVKGSVLLYDVNQDTYLSNDFSWARSGHLPASTFKIPNSIIGLETGVIEGKETVFKWDGNPRRLSIWEQDLALPDAFQFSCLPCYREVARAVGLERMRSTLDKIDYPGMEFDAENLDLFWVAGNSRISQMQQIDFLRRFHGQELPIAKRTHEIVTDILVIEETDRFKLSGKTGWSVDGETNNGWIVGYIQTGEKLYFYATNLEPSPGFDIKDFGRVRRHVTMKSFYKLGLIH